MRISALLLLVSAVCVTVASAECPNRPGLYARVSVVDSLSYSDWMETSTLEELLSGDPIDSTSFSEMIAAPLSRVSVQAVLVVHRPWWKRVLTVVPPNYAVQLSYSDPDADLSFHRTAFTRDHRQPSSDGDGFDFVRPQVRVMRAKTNCKSGAEIFRFEFRFRVPAKLQKASLRLSWWKRSRWWQRQTPEQVHEATLASMEPPMFLGDVPSSTSPSTLRSVRTPFSAQLLHRGILAQQVPDFRGRRLRISRDPIGYVDNAVDGILDPELPWLIGFHQFHHYLPKMKTKRELSVELWKWSELDGEDTLQASFTFPMNSPDLITCQPETDNLFRTFFIGQELVPIAHSIGSELEARPTTDGEAVQCYHPTDSDLSFIEGMPNLKYLSGQVYSYRLDVDIQKWQRSSWYYAKVVTQIAQPQSIWQSFLAKHTSLQKREVVLGFVYLPEGDRSKEDKDQEEE